MSKLSPDDVVFTQATTPEQLTAVWALNAEAWAEPLSVQDHINRERTLSQQDATGDLWKTWILTTKQDLGEIIVSCETFEKDVFVNDGKKFSKYRGYSIASVFTNPKYRGNRMANLLLERVKTWMDGEGEGFVSVLYSDIGPTFYAKLGWIPHSTATLVLETDPRISEGSRVSEQGILPRFRQLEQDNLKELCDKDIELLQTELETIQNGERTHFAFPPTFANISWHIAREDLNAKLIHGRSKTRFRGAQSDTDRAWMIWHFDEIEKKLKVQRIVLLDKDKRERNIREIASLIRFGQWVAKDSGVTTMLIWNPCEEVIEGAKLLASHYPEMKMKVEERKGSIPSVRLRGGRGEKPEPVWEANEYYAWC